MPCMKQSGIDESAKSRKSVTPAFAGMTQKQKTGLLRDHQESQEETMKCLFSRGLCCCLLFIALAGIPAGTALSGTLPEKGSVLPEFSMTAPEAEEERVYLGIGNDPEFTFDKIKADIVVLEIVGVYCPICHKQFPQMNQFFSRVEKDKALSGRVRIVSVAAGNTDKEVAYLKKQFKISYPVLSDPKFDIHKALGEPKTPFTMLVTKDRKVVYTHLGRIADFDKFFSQIREMIPQTP